MQTALQAVNGNCIGFVFNQHHVLSPRAFEYTEIALKMHENALVVIPGYTTTQVNPDRVSHDTVATLGYKLFADAKFSPINPQGFMCPMHGFGFMACRKAVAQKQLDSIHGKVAPHHADLMDALYQAIGRDEKMSLSIIPGEGAFSPDHLTSPEKNKRHQNPPLCREPFLIGSITYAAQKFFAESSEHASKRFQSLAEQGAPYWSHDPAGRYSENTSSDSAPSKTWVTIPIRPVEFWE